jgi:hypothetical protein
MSCRCIVSVLRSLLLLEVAAGLLFTTAICSSSPASAQETPIATIDDDCTAMAYAPDGRIVYSVRHGMKTREYNVERDDFWVMNTNGKRRRIILGEKLGGAAPFSYMVSSLHWSPNGQLLAAELDTRAVIDKEGNERESMQTLLFDQEGKEFRLGSAGPFLENAFDAAWLSDEVTVVYLTEAVKPNLLFSIQAARPVAGRRSSLFEGRTFLAVAWDTKKSLGYAIERDRNFEGPPRLQRLDLVKETSDELATLDTYSGRLTVSPSGDMAAYYLDHEVLEIRDLAAPSRIARVRIGYGVYAWSPDGSRILLKRAPEKKTGELVWFEVPSLSAPVPGGPPDVLQPTLVPLLNDLTFRDFQIAPDGHEIAVMRPGKQDILIYPWK